MYCVKVYDGNSSSAPELAKLCGSLPPTTINSSKHELHVKLRTDHSVNAGGFIASYTTGTKTCTQTNNQTHQMEIIISGIVFSLQWRADLWAPQGSGGVTELPQRLSTQLPVQLDHPGQRWEHHQLHLHCLCRGGDPQQLQL